ncbi:hypothetical protein [Streptomyces sp. HD]|uniref:hypothetical protein n=1 Tax=Streptomyces sp. HD TaxID=3020892 RepID=UPI00232F3B24|nr:hypothetical protein [Streptomyces sp. HD]MDC0766159.1 hypothetical protein [Streptomyces sp. HD]
MSVRPAPTGGLRIPPVVLKVLITAAVGTTAYVISNLIAPSQEDLWQVALAVVIGGAALIVQYMVDFEERLGALENGQRQHRRELTELVDQGFRQVGEVTDLFGRLEDSGMPSGEVKRLARSAAQVGSQGRGFLQEFARAEIERLASMMTALASAHGDWPGENSDLLIGLARCARKSIYATSSYVDLDFWETATAKYYLDVQREAIQRHGVQVRRLFIVKDPHELSASLDKLLEQQRGTGIEVGVVVLSELPSNIRVGETLDVVIFDEVLCFEITTDVQQLNPNARLDARQDKVARRKARFEHLWDARTVH